tara:strand:+ start:69 stop:245 length:177 start_codon:yes stop_codon:yes gene_type:complete
MKKSYVVKKYMLKIELNDTLIILQFKELFNQQIKQSKNIRKTMVDILHLINQELNQRN